MFYLKILFQDHCKHFHHCSCLLQSHNHHCSSLSQCHCHHCSSLSQCHCHHCSSLSQCLSSLSQCLIYILKFDTVRYLCLEGSKCKAVLEKGLGAWKVAIQVMERLAITAAVYSRATTIIAALYPSATAIIAAV